LQRVSSAGRPIQRRPKINRSTDGKIAGPADDGRAAAPYGRSHCQTTIEEGTTMRQLWDRWAPLTGVLSVACLVVGTLMVLDQPQDKDSDAKIVAYFADHSHRVKGIVGFFVFLAGIIFLLVFLSALRERLLSAEGQPGGLTALAFGAGVASAPLSAVSMLFANGTLFASNNTSAFHPDPNTFRLLADTAYIAWVSAVIVSALVVWATSAIALRTGLLPRWYAQIGILVGVIQLFAFLFFPFFVWLLWILGTSLLLTRRGTAVRATAAAASI
jgi:hypothetical protein